MHYTTAEPDNALTIPDVHSGMAAIVDFLSGDEHIFMLQGAAGTGKTTLLKSVIEYLRAAGKNVLLFAPTGRAAKVLSEKTGLPACTIHRGIYNFSIFKQQAEGDLFCIIYSVADNPMPEQTVIIVDEASMIPDNSQSEVLYRCGSGKVLTDLMEFSRIPFGSAHSKIIFSGDHCQLPPVGDCRSRAFDADYLSSKFGALVTGCTLTKIYRQQENSGLLKLAAGIRSNILTRRYNNFIIPRSADVVTTDAYCIAGDYCSAPENKVIVVYKNSTALRVNESVRRLLWNKENCEMQPGDALICGHNNYMLGILNGEFLELVQAGKITEQRTIKVKINGETSLVQLRWCDVAVKRTGGNGEPVTGKILLNFLEASSGLTLQERVALFIDFKMRHPGMKPKSEEFRDAVLKDEYYNCLLLKYGYAVTCHKAQGGEWDTVFVYREHNTGDPQNESATVTAGKGMANESFFRWMYTAVSRAKVKLHFHQQPQFHPFSGLQLSAEALQEVTADRRAKQSAPAGVQPEIVVYEPRNGSVTLTEALAGSGWKIIQQNRKGYEFTVQLKNGNETVGLKTHINKKEEINGKYSVVPGLTRNPLAAEQLLQRAFAECTPVVTEPNTAVPETGKEKSGIITGIIPASVLRNIQESSAYSESCAELNGRMKEIAEMQEMSIEHIEHLPYRERYTLCNERFSVCIDFLCKADGFWSTAEVKEITAGAKSEALVIARFIIDTLKEQAYNNESNAIFSAGEQQEKHTPKPKNKTKETGNAWK